jgi:lipopolysaccharide export system ATP-binding protein
MSTIIVNKVVKSFKKRTVVDKVSFYLKKGEIVGLLGPNGAGKTTTFYMIVGLIQADSGEIFFDDIEITKIPMYKRARLGIGYLPQEASVFRKLSVEDNIRAILEFKQGIKKQEIESETEKLLKQLEIVHIRKSKGYQLSGGERRRTEIARALASKPMFLLLDEPFAGVDPIAVQEIQRLIARLRDENGIGILITDHNARETLRITDRAYILTQGNIRISGRSVDIANDPKARELYLGDEFSM